MSVPEGDPNGAQPKPGFSRNAVYFGLLFEGGLILIAWLLGWLFKQPPHQTLQFDFTGLALGVAASLPMLAGLVVVTWLPFAPFKRLQRVFDEFGRPFFAPFTIFDLAVLSLMAGFGEELLFRGVVQAVLERWWGSWIALCVASLLFGVLHALTPTYALLAALAGVYLGGVWLLTDNLLVPIVAHGLYDFVALVYLLRVKVAPERLPSS